MDHKSRLTLYAHKDKYFDYVMKMISLARDKLNVRTMNRSWIWMVSAW